MALVVSVWPTAYVPTLRLSPACPPPLHRHKGGTETDTETGTGTSTATKTGTDMAEAEALWAALEALGLPCLADMVETLTQREDEAEQATGRMTLLQPLVAYSMHDPTYVFHWYATCVQIWGAARADLQSDLAHCAFMSSSTQDSMVRMTGVTLRSPESRRHLGIDSADTTLYLAVWVHGLLIHKQVTNITEEDDVVALTRPLLLPAAPWCKSYCADRELWVQTFPAGIVSGIAGTMWAWCNETLPSPTVFAGAGFTRRDREDTFFRPHGPSVPLPPLLRWSPAAPTPWCRPQPLEEENVMDPVYGRIARVPCSGEPRPLRSLRHAPPDVLTLFPDVGVAETTATTATTTATTVATTETATFAVDVADATPQSVVVAASTCDGAVVS